MNDAPIASDRAPGGAKLYWTGGGPIRVSWARAAPVRQERTRAAEANDGAGRVIASPWRAMQILALESPTHAVPAVRLRRRSHGRELLQLRPRPARPPDHPEAGLRGGRP